MFFAVLLHWIVLAHNLLYICNKDRTPRYLLLVNKRYLIEFQQPHFSLIQIQPSISHKTFCCTDAVWINKHQSLQIQVWQRSAQFLKGNSVFLRVIISINEQKVVLLGVIFVILPSPNIIHHIWLGIAVGVFCLLLRKDSSRRLFVIAFFLLKQPHFFTLHHQRTLVSVLLLVDYVPHCRQGRLAVGCIWLRQTLAKALGGTLGTGNSCCRELCVRDWSGSVGKMSCSWARALWSALVVDMLYDQFIFISKSLPFSCQDLILKLSRSISQKNIRKSTGPYINHRSHTLLSVTTRRQFHLFLYCGRLKISLSKRGGKKAMVAANKGAKIRANLCVRGQQQSVAHCEYYLHSSTLAKVVIISPQIYLSASECSIIKQESFFQPRVSWKRAWRRC